MIAIGKIFKFVNKANKNSKFGIK